MRWFTVPLMILMAGSPLAAQEATDSTRQAEVRAVVHEFHGALAAGDSLAALALLHPDLVVYESGHAETLAEYRSGHLGSDIAFAAATQREVRAENVTLWGDVALYTSVTHTTGTWRGRDIDSGGTGSMVLVRTADGWRIRHIHWS